MGNRNDTRDTQAILANALALAEQQIAEQADLIARLEEETLRLLRNIERLEERSQGEEEP